MIFHVWKFICQIDLVPLLETQASAMVSWYRDYCHFIHFYLYTARFPFIFVFQLKYSL